MGTFAEYAEYDGIGLAEFVRRGEIQPIELVEEAVRRIEALNPRLNAVIHKMYDVARKVAEGPLPDGPFKGVPFLLKDLVATYGGEPIRNGSRFFEGYVPPRDSELVTRFKGAGLVILGKTNTPEFGLSTVTEPELFGPTRNPWDLRRTTGGSSGGSGAAVAARIVPLAHGNDGGGSIRIPAACCGLFGLKPSRGRVPTGPDHGELWWGFAAEHVLTRSVRDSAAVLDVTAGPDIGAPYYAPPPPRPFLEEVGTPPGTLRVAFTGRPFLADSVHPECLRGLEKTVELLRELGHETVEAAPEFDTRGFATAYLTALCGEVRADIEEGEEATGRKAKPSDFEIATWAFAVLGKRIPASDTAKSIRLLHRYSRQIARFFEDHDVLLTPTLGMPPVEIGALRLKWHEATLLTVLGRLNAGRVMRAMRMIEMTAEEVFRFTPFTAVFNVTGQPAMSVPLYWTAAGLPLGMQFVARYGQEGILFRLAAQLEEARPWRDKVPPICE